jgi:hypothetical protein
MLPGRRYVAIHTHHQSTAFSDRDVELLLCNAQIHTIIAIGHDRTWHVLSKQPDVAVASPTTAAAAFAAALRLLSPHFLRLAMQGVVTREEALRRMLHQVWQAIAAPLGLRYDRVHSARRSNGGQAP